MVTQELMECEEEGSNDENLCDNEELVPHADGAAALDLALRYLEQQATATPANIMLMTRCSNYPSSNRYDKRQLLISCLLTINNVLNNNTSTVFDIGKGNSAITGLEFHKVFDIGKGNSAITGLEFHKVPNLERYFIIATTPNRIYQFVGNVNSSDERPLLQQIFNIYLTRAEGFIEVPSKRTLKYSKLQFFYPKSTQRHNLPTSFAWLTEESIFYGQFLTPLQLTHSLRMTKLPATENAGILFCFLLTQNGVRIAERVVQGIPEASLPERVTSCPCRVCLSSAPGAGPRVVRARSALGFGTNTSELHHSRATAQLTLRHYESSCRMPSLLVHRPVRHFRMTTMLITRSECIDVAGEGDEVLADSQRLNYPLSPPAAPPINFVLTEFHVLLLYPNRVVGVSTLNQAMVFEDFYNEVGLYVVYISVMK
ncbi:Vacuolar protein sorting-associated protein 18 like protein [Homalodisca vitripennis]|nr:Vacuolar protein sorting-associated protein 18 like protein [Homalodisca vitripennis]